MPPCRLSLLAMVLFIWAGALQGAGPAATPAIDISVCYGPFRARSYLEVAAALQALPEAPRVAQLRAWAAIPKAGHDAFGDKATADYIAKALAAMAPEKRSEGLRELEKKYRPEGELDEQVIILCRMLFEAAPGHEFRGPTHARTPGKAWYYLAGYHSPLDPIALSNGIPFQVARFDLASDMGMYMLPLESPERGVDYLEYCLTEARWSSVRYDPTVDKATMQKALDALADTISPAKSLGPADTKQLADQILRHQIPAFSLGETLHQGNSTRSFSKGQFAPPFDLGVRLKGGKKPYRYSLDELVTSPGSTVILGIAQGGVGESTSNNPFVDEQTVLPWDGVFPTAGGIVVLRIQDANGATITQKITALPTGEDLFNPPETAPMSAP